MFRSLLCALSLSPLFAQAPTTPAAAPKVEVPTFANATCPIMGKKVSMSLFVDTELGRFYVCCKPCFKKIQADLPAAHKTAYPVVQDAKNTTCPVSGEAIGEHAVAVTLQGWRVALCCSGCEAAARTHSQVTLVKATRPVTDVGNTTCPVTNEPVSANAFALVGDALVHLASPKAADELAKDPAAALDKARAIAKAQPPKPKHEHVPTKDKPAAPATKPEPGK
jgi:hypothetical protein